MQKVINALAVASFVVSAGVVGSGAYLYFNKDVIIDGVKEAAMNEVKDLLPGLIGGGLGGLAGGIGGGALIPESSPVGGAAAGAGAASLPIPSGFGF